MHKADNHLVSAGEGVRIAVPPHWKRNAVVVFSSDKSATDRGASVVVRRESLDPRITLNSYMDNLLIELARSLPEFALLGRADVSLGHRPAAELRFSVKNRGTLYEQRHICTLDVTGSVLSIVLSSTAEEAADLGHLWDQIISTAELAHPRSSR